MNKFVRVRSRIVPDVYTELNLSSFESWEDVARSSGLAPRDGSEIVLTTTDYHLLSGHITTNYDEVLIGPPMPISTSRCKAKWVNKQGFGVAKINNWTRQLIPGLKKGQTADVHIIEKNSSKKGITYEKGYIVNVKDTDPYPVGSLVLIHPEKDTGNRGGWLLDPKTGEETIWIEVQVKRFKNRTSEQQREFFSGCLWTVEVTENNEGILEGNLIKSMTYNPKLARMKK